jgi:hypothetical protein
VFFGKTSNKSNPFGFPTMRSLAGVSWLLRWLFFNENPEKLMAWSTVEPELIKGDNE